MPTFHGNRAAGGVPRVARSMPAVRGYTTGNNGYFEYPYAITGVTKDSTGSVLASCTVVMYRTADNSFAAQTTSDASGNYWLNASPELTHYLVAYKAGAPDVAGTSVNTLVGV